MPKLGKTRVAILAPTPAPYRAYEYDRLHERLADEIEFKVFFLEATQADMGWADDRFPSLMPYDVLPELGWPRKLPVVGRLRWNREVISHLQAWDTDVVYLHAYDSPSHWQALRWALCRGKRVLFRSDSNILAETGDGTAGIRRRATLALKRRVLRYLFARVDAFLTVGSRNEAYFKHYGAECRRFYRACYLFNDEFVYERAVQARAEAAPLRSKLGIACDAKVLLYVGRLIPIKAVDVLINAFQILRRKRGDVELVLVGDGFERAALETLVARQPEAIHFAGYQHLDQIAAHYGNADIFVLPSEREPYGFVATEAMAAGVPIIVTDVCGVTLDMVVPRVTGVEVPPRNVETLVAAVDQMLEAQGFGRWGEQARQHWLRWRDTFDVAEQTRRAVLGLDPLVSPAELKPGRELWP